MKNSIEKGMRECKRPREKKIAKKKIKGLVQKVNIKLEVPERKKNI